jgi:colanic acid biosynthesis glycosyl transferase WcaI
MRAASVEHRAIAATLDRADVSEKQAANTADSPGAEANAPPTKILIHGINYAPELIGVGRYTRDLAEYLARRGHPVEVITAPPHYPGWWVRPPYRAYAYSSEELNGVKVRRCPLFTHRSGQGIWRFLAPLTFALTAAPVAAWRILRSRPDVVVCVEPTLFSAPVAALAAKIVGARTVLHVHDLEVDAAFAVNHLRGDLFKRVALAVERMILRQFDTIVTISDQMRLRLLQKQVPGDRLVIVRNWADLSQIRFVGGPNPFRDQLGLSASDFVVLYSGQIGPKQALHFVLAAAQRLQATKHIHFVIAGEGSLKAQFVERYGNLPNIHFLPLQPEDRFCELLNLANLHILPQDGAAADLVLPSKVGAMLASLRPILVQANEGTELYQMLKDVVRIIPPGNVAALEEAVIKAQTTNADVSRYGEIAALFGRDAALATLLGVLVGGEPEPVHAGLSHDAPQAALTPSVSGAAAQ